MEEVKLKERALMDEEEFNDYLKEHLEDKENLIERFNKEGYLFIQSFNGVSKFKSVRRAIRRGNMSMLGYIYPRRPFNNRANTSERKYTHSRVFNEKRKSIYGQLRKTM